MTGILLVTDGIFHPPLLGRFILHGILRKMEGYSFEHIRSLDRLPEDLDRFSAMVLHYHHRRISPGALARLETFVGNGGGILAIHSATASFKQAGPYFEILGGRFIGHAAVENIQVRQVKEGFFGGIGDFVIKDELYLHEFKAGIEVFFTARHAGEDVPVVWTYRHGKGKVCYAMPGHTSAVMSSPAYQEILCRGLKWVAE